MIPNLAHPDSADMPLRYYKLPVPGIDRRIGVGAIDLRRIKLTKFDEGFFTNLYGFVSLKVLAFHRAI